MSHVFLALCGLAVIGVVIVQNVVYPPLRQETISEGLNGPDHVALDAAFGLLAIALVWAAWGDALLEATAVVAAIGLVGISVTNTAWRWVDGLTGKLGGHEKWHLAFTVVAFLGAFAFQIAGDHGYLWWVSAVNFAAPLVVFLLSRRQDYAEKVGVLILCLWLVAWAF